MSDLLLSTGISNLILSSALAVVAYAVHRTGRFPRAAHLLWLLVLVKLVTPSFVTVPLLGVRADSQVQSAAAITTTTPGPTATNLRAHAPGAATFPNEHASLAAPAAPAVSQTPAPWSLGTVLLWAWLLGSGVVLMTSLARIRRFHRLLERSVAPAPPALTARATAIGKRLGLKRIPRIETTTARVTPLVWGAGRRARVVLPLQFVQRSAPARIDWVLAHELAHVRRGDHLVRWLEWVTCVVCWWNPIAWFARAGLRANEEVCCDALVLARMAPHPRPYARALLAVAEFLSQPVARPPALATGMHAGGSLTRRFEMILSTKPTTPMPRWLRNIAACCIVALLPLGIAYADEHPAPEKPSAEKLEAMNNAIRQLVSAGVLTHEEGRAKLAAWLTKYRADRDSESPGHHPEDEHTEDGHHEDGHTGEHASRTKPDGLAGAYASMGVKAEKLEGLRGVLAQHGLNEAQVESALRGMLRIIPGMKTQGSDYLLDAATKLWLTREGGLIEEQLPAVTDLAQRLCKGLKRGGHHADAGVPTPAKIAAKKKLLAALVAKGKLTEEQARLRLESYMTHGGGEAHSAAQLQATIQKIRAAVAAGRLQVEEAERKIRYLRERADPAFKARRSAEMAKAKAEIWARVASGEITKDQAMADWKAYVAAQKLLGK